MSLQYSHRHTHRHEPNHPHDEYDSNMSLTVCETAPQISDLLFYASNLSASEEAYDGETRVSTKRRSSFRDRCFTALSSVRSASNRILSHLTQSSHLNNQGSLIHVSPAALLPKEDIGSLTLRSDVFETVLRSYNVDRNSIDAHGATYNTRNPNSSRQLTASGDDFVLRDIFGRLVRPRPRLIEIGDGEEAFKRQPSYESTISSDEDLSDSLKERDDANDFTNSEESDDYKRKRSIFKMGFTRNDRKSNEVGKLERSLPSSRKENGEEALENGTVGSNSNNINNKHLGKFAKLCQGPYLGLFGRYGSKRGNEEDDEGNSDSLSPYYGNGTMVNPEMSKKVKEQVVKKTESLVTTVRAGDEAKVNEVEDMTMRAKRQLSGISDGIVSCESGPLPSWIEEAVWEVETTESFLID